MHTRSRTNWNCIAIILAAIFTTLLFVFLTNQHYDYAAMPPVLSATADNAALPDIDSDVPPQQQLETTTTVITYDPLTGLFVGDEINDTNQPLYAEYIDDATGDARTVFIGLPGAQQAPNVSATDQNGNPLSAQWMQYEGHNWLAFDRLVVGSVTVTYDLTTPKGCQVNEQCYAA